MPQSDVLTPAPMWPAIRRCVSFDEYRGAGIKIPESILIEGEGHAVPGHPPKGEKRQWLQDRCSMVLSEFDDWDAYSFMDRCKIRDNAMLEWRLPGCEGGCKECAPIRRCNHSNIPHLEGCPADWWYSVPESTELQVRRIRTETITTGVRDEACGVGFTAAVPYEHTYQEWFVVRALPFTYFDCHPAA